MKVLSPGLRSLGAEGAAAEGGGNPGPEAVARLQAGRFRGLSVGRGWADAGKEGTLEGTPRRGSCTWWVGRWCHPQAQGKGRKGQGVQMGRAGMAEWVGRQRPKHGPCGHHCEGRSLRGMWAQRGAGQGPRGTGQTPCPEATGSHALAASEPAGLYDSQEDGPALCCGQGKGLQGLRLDGSPWCPATQCPPAISWLAPSPFPGCDPMEGGRAAGQEAGSARGGSRGLAGLTHRQEAHTKQLGW